MLERLGLIWEWSESHLGSVSRAGANSPCVLDTWATWLYGDRPGYSQNGGKEVPARNLAEYTMDPCQRRAVRFPNRLSLTERERDPGRISVLLPE